VYRSNSEKAPLASLSLVLDALSLSKTKDPLEGGCRFCGVLVQALDALFEDWQGVGQRVSVDLEEKGTIKLGVEGEKWKREVVEIYAVSGTWWYSFVSKVSIAGANNVDM
jgi:hypothetical protein